MTEKEKVPRKKKEKIRSIEDRIDDVEHGIEIYLWADFVHCCVLVQEIKCLFRSIGISAAPAAKAVRKPSVHREDPCLHQQTLFAFDEPVIPVKKSRKARNNVEPCKGEACPECLNQDECEDYDSHSCDTCKGGIFDGTVTVSMDCPDYPDVSSGKIDAEKLREDTRKLGCSHWSAPGSEAKIPNISWCCGTRDCKSLDWEGGICITTGMKIKEQTHCPTLHLTGKEKPTEPNACTRCKNSQDCIKRGYPAINCGFRSSDNPEEIPTVCLHCEHAILCMEHDPKAGCSKKFAEIRGLYVPGDQFREYREAREKAARHPKKKEKAPASTCKNEDGTCKDCKGRTECSVPFDRDCITCHLKDGCGNYGHPEKGCAYQQYCCGLCGHHKGRKTFHDTCPRLGELLFKGGTKSAKVLMDETAGGHPCMFWISKEADRFGPCPEKNSMGTCMHGAYSCPHKTEEGRAAVGCKYPIQPPHYAGDSPVLKKPAKRLKKDTPYFCNLCTIRQTCYCTPMSEECTSLGGPRGPKDKQKIGKDLQYCETLCANCGNHLASFSEICPRYGDLKSQGGKHSEYELMEEVQRDGCTHKTPKIIRENPVRVCPHDGMCRDDEKIKKQRETTEATGFPCENVCCMDCPGEKKKKKPRSKKSYSIKITPVTEAQPTLIEMGRKYCTDCTGPTPQGSSGSQDTKENVVKSILQTLNIWQKSGSQLTEKGTPITEKDVKFGDTTGEFTVDDFFDADGKLKSNQESETQS